MTEDDTLSGAGPDGALIDRLLAATPEALMREAAALRDRAHPRFLSYSRKVFVPLTQLCRDVCHYCTFAQSPRTATAPYLDPDEVLAIVRRGEASGCTEALLTLGDKPELRYGAAREALAARGFDTTIDYLVHVCGRILHETGLLPHVNPGVLGAEDIARLRPVAASMGIMLESTSRRLLAKGGCHHGSPDKDPAVRLATIREAGRQKVPFTTGILIGIGETRRERLEALIAIRDLHREHGHIQEVIVQNFRAKPGTRMAAHPEPGLDDLKWTIAAARLLLGPAMNIQAPPNLSAGHYGELVAAGLNDWGGVSPVTPDHVNPEAAWPHLHALAAQSRAAGRELVQRLPSYPAYVRAAEDWHDPAVAPKLRAMADAAGYARADDWAPGRAVAVPALADDLPAAPALSALGGLTRLLSRAGAGEALSEADLVGLFEARGAALPLVMEAADGLRRERCGDIVSYAVNRNINYTNVCRFSCGFCAFSKGQKSDRLRGRAYDVPLDEVVRRAREAWDRGATEVCLQGGIHPDYSEDTYLAIVRGIRAAVPGMHVHAFSPLEVTEGARAAGVPVAEYLQRLKEAGLGSLPGTSAEILDDEVRARICPDKLMTGEWLAVMRDAHRLGIRTTATIMFGHVERPVHWARHLLRLRALQAETGGFTEFVPLPFVHMEAPMFLRGRARSGPTFREAVLMHAVARIALYRLIDNIQVSWVKMGEDGVAVALRAGVNDLGGTLMNESISNAAGTSHGQEWSPARMERVIRAAGRTPRQRTTLYATPAVPADADRFDAAPLAPIELPAAAKFAAIGSRRQRQDQGRDRSREEPLDAA